MKKLQLYILSLWLLFLLIFVKELVIVSHTFEFSLEGVKNFVAPNVLPVASIFLLALGLYFYLVFSYQLKGSTMLPKSIRKIEDQSYEHLAFLTTYIIPFLRVKLEGRDLLITILLLVIIGAIFVRTNLFYKNPTLALLGYKLYKVDTESSTGLVFISRNVLKAGDKVHHIHLSDNIYFVKL